MALALVPLSVGLTFGALLLPRRARPDFVPLPIADALSLSRTESADHRLAEQARAVPLPGAVRALGSAIRAFHTFEAHDADARQLGEARRAVDEALIEALRLPDGEGGCSLFAHSSSRISPRRCAGSSRAAKKLPNFARSRGGSCER